MYEMHVMYVIFYGLRVILICCITTCVSTFMLEVYVIFLSSYYSTSLDWRHGWQAWWPKVEPVGLESSRVGPYYFTAEMFICDLYPVYAVTFVM